jgi:ferredoxin
MKRSIITIDQEKCTGCGLCIPNCPEGALQIIDSKARLLSDLFCDGLGACLGHCPEGAITIEDREAEDYDERKVMTNVVKQGPNVIQAHLDHLQSHKQYDYVKQAKAYLRENNIDVPGEVAPMMHAHGGGCPEAGHGRFPGRRHRKRPRQIPKLRSLGSGRCKCI